MFEEFKKHIEKEFPLLDKNTFLLACSGGVDSMVLTDLCAKSGLDFSLAHCNFRLRGAESDKDEKLIKKIATKLNKKLYVTHFDTIGYINKNKVSLQVGARELRYSWFAEIMKENRISTLVTAHHADDSLETFLINLSRGTGIDGLTGIPEKTDFIARPLLRFSRNQILEYAKSQDLEWREDTSNSDTKYLRNDIRHKIVPLLKELNPIFLENFQKTQKYLSQTAKIIDRHTEQLKKQFFVKNDGIIRIAVAALSNLKPTEAYLHALFKDYGFTEWNDVLNLLTAMSGKEVYSKTHRLVKDREHLLLTKISVPENQVYRIEEHQTEIDSPIQFKIETVEDLGETGKHILYVDKKALKYPLSIRKWKNGDYFYPLGMDGKKKLSKFFKDEKIDVLSKERQWLLCSENQIVWVIGKRADERFKVMADTTNILKFELNK